MWQKIEEISENLSKMAVESDAERRLDLAVTTKTSVNALYQAMREEISRIHIELRGSDYTKEAVSPAPLTERPKLDMQKIELYIKHPNTTVTSEVLHYLTGIGYFNAKE